MKDQTDMKHNKITSLRSDSLEILWMLETKGILLKIHRLRNMKT